MAFRKLSLLILILSSIHGAHAFCGLGEAENSVNSDSDKLKGTHVLMSSQTELRHHEIDTGVAGTTVREYVNAGGDIYAITWQGRTLPSLSVLLASHYDDYKKELRSRSKIHGRAPFEFKGDDFQVSIFGNRGKAIIPSKVPAGLDLGKLE